MTALDAIGILGSGGELEFLRGRYAALTGKDKFMALKAIGDAGDAESLRFVGEQATTPLYADEAGMRNLVDLYTGR